MKAASKRYVESYRNTNQKLWREGSQSIIEHIAKELRKKYLYFPDLLAYLAKERQQLALLLKDPDAKLFGSFCTENRHGSELIKNNDCCLEEVLPDVEHLLKKGVVTQTEVCFTFDNPFKQVFPESDVAKKREKAIWASDVLHQNNFNNHSYTLLADLRFGFNDTLSTLLKTNQGEIILSYRTYNKYNLVGDYFTAQVLYDELLNWNLEMGINSYLESAAKFSYLMSHCIFVIRGMTSITEYIIRGIASNHGLKLEDFKEDPVGWPWRALTTDSIEKYISWFKTNSYIIKNHFHEASYKKSFFSEKNRDLAPECNDSVMTDSLTS